MPEHTDSVLQRVADKMFSRIRLAGLMHAFMDQGLAQAKEESGEHTEEKGIGEETPPFLAFWEESAEIFPCLEEAAKISGIAPIHLAGHPFVYNSVSFEEGDPWASDGLDGKTVSLRKMMAGYGALWKLQVGRPGGATNRIVKAAVWFSEQEKNRGSAFRLLLSLNRAGFFCRREALGLAAIKLAELYSRRADYSPILRLTFAEEGQLKAERLISGFDTAILAEIGGWLLDRTRQAIGDARAASSPTEWNGRLAEVSNLIAAVQRFEREFSVIDELPQQYRIQYLALDEISCDFVAMFLGNADEIKDRAALEESWSMASAMLELQMTAGGPEAVERLFSARLLLPDAVGPYVWPLLPGSEVGRDTDYFRETPGLWKHFGLEVAHVLARQAGVNPACLRWNRLAVSGKEEEAEHKPCEQIERELEAFLNRYKEATGSGADNARRLEIVNEVLALYPLHDGYRLERAILQDEMGLHEAALNELIENICLAPTRWMHWKSLSVVCGKLGYGADRQAALLISKVLERRSDDSGDERHADY